MADTAFQRLTDALRAHGRGVRDAGGGKALAQCPAHDDGKPSLSVTNGETRVLVHCFAGCQTDDVLAALGLARRDLFDTPRGAAYRYTDSAGATLRTVHRSPEKRFRQSGDTKTRPILYRLPQVLEAAQQRVPIFLVEGEEDVHALELLGAVATTAPQGAGNFAKVDVEPLRGADVLAVVDKDTAGLKWAQAVATTLDSVAESITWLQAAHGKDASDHVAAGGTLETLLEIEPVTPSEPLVPVSEGGMPVTGIEPETGQVLTDVRAWLGRFITVLHERDLDLLTLWAAHTYLAFECYTTPRLVIDSPVHGSGKTTVLEHLERLARRPVQMASLSSPALLTRMLDAEPRTILIDEADRSLDPKKEGIAELVAVLNSGYKRGGSRPVLVPGKEGSWTVKEMPTFAPCAMAGNNPALPEDTRSRCVRVLLMPDSEGRAEESDWELIDTDARTLGRRLESWAEVIRDEVRSTRPDLPDGVRGRTGEKWRPLKRIACAAGGDWLRIVDELAVHDVEQQEQDREDGMTIQHPHVVLLHHLHQIWPAGLTFVPTADLVRDLAIEHPDMWGDGSSFGKALTAQRFGRMLARSYGVNSTRLSATGPRGYTRASLERPWQRLGVTSAAG